MGLLTPRRSVAWLLLAMLIVGAPAVQGRAPAAADQPPNHHGWYPDNGGGHQNHAQPTSVPAARDPQASSGQGDWGGQEPHRLPPRREQPGQPHQQPQYDQRPSGLVPLANDEKARIALTSRDPPASNGKSGKHRDSPWGDVAPEDYSNVDKEKMFRALWEFYRKRVLPLEIAYQYEHFENKTLMTEADFMSQPMVFLLGPYSVGKTSFIRSLIKCDFPGQNIGPEPTTDKFTAVMYGKKMEQPVPGHSAVLQPDKPFTALRGFGSDFLSRFEVAGVPSAFSKEVMLVDSPGILSGEKQRKGRGYKYEEIVRWFADRADRIVIMFDAHKLDISDELREIIRGCIREHQDKVRILLNKADMINAQQLMRVYGALMWQLSQVFNTPESPRVYVSSFWERPISNVESRAVLEREKYDLMKELLELPSDAVNRRINELYKRIRSVRVHCFLIHHLRKKVPRMWGKEAKMRKLLHLGRLEHEMRQCAAKTKYRVASGDLPELYDFGRKLSMVDIRKYGKLDKSKVVNLDQDFSDYLQLKLKEARIPPPGSAPSASWR